MARALVERHGGQVPRTRAELVRLPGVGLKTASVVLGNAFGEPAIAVDTHVFRVSQRLGLPPPGARPWRGQKAALPGVPGQGLLPLAGKDGGGSPLSPG